jgi:gluconolactonase
MARIQDLYVIAEGLDHPECVNPGPDGTLYAGGEIGQIYRIDDQAKTATQVGDTGGYVGGVCLDAAGMVYAFTATDPPQVARIDPGTGAVDTYCATAEGTPLVTPNYGSFAADGTLWFTDSGPEVLEVKAGRLIRVAPGGGDGEVVDVGEAMHFANGMCLDGDGVPCVLETLTPRLSRVRDGRLETIAEFPGNSPDGVAYCADGGFLVSMYHPFRLVYVPPGGGSWEVVLDDVTGIHIPMPTNVCFYGDDLDRVAIASLGGWVVKGIDLGLRGVPLHYPEIPRP